VVALAGLLGLAAGSGATLAGWSLSVPRVVGSITAGSLKLEPSPSGWTWHNTSPDLPAEILIADPSAWHATPGDLLLGSWQVDATSVGDNVAGLVSIAPNDSPATTWPAGVSVTWRVGQTTTHTAAQVLDPAATGFASAPLAYPDGSASVRTAQAGTQPVVVYLVVQYAGDSVIPDSAPALSDYRFTVDFSQERP